MDHRKGESLELMPLATKTTEVIHSSSGATFGHQQICPTDPHTVLMCRYGPYGDLIEQRMWLWKRSWGEARPINPPPNCSLAGHEIWMPDGNEIVYFRYSWKDKTKTMPHPITTPEVWPEI